MLLLVRRPADKQIAQRDANDKGRDARVRLVVTKPVNKWSFKFKFTRKRNHWPNDDKMTKSLHVVNILVVPRHFIGRTARNIFKVITRMHWKITQSKVEH